MGEAEFAPDLVRAVAEAIHRAGCPGASCTTVLGRQHLERARAALAVAAPAVAVAEKGKVANLAQACANMARMLEERDDEIARLRAQLLDGAP